MNRPTEARTQYIVLAALIIAASLLRVFVCFQHNPVDYLFSDSLKHWTHGADFPGGRYDGAADPILYQVYVAVLRRVTADNRYLVALASALMSVLMPWTYYRGARSFGLAKVPAMWVWALIAWTPSLFVIYHYMMMETLLLLVEGAALWATARYLRKGGAVAFVILVMCWTLGSLTKTTLIPLAMVCFLWACWKKMPTVRAIAVGALVVVVLLTPQAIRTKLELGFVAPFGNPWFTKIQHRSGARRIQVHFHSHGNQLFHTHSNTEELSSSSPSANVRPLWPLSGWTMHRSGGNSVVTLSVDTAHGAQDWKEAYADNDVGMSERLLQLRENIVLFAFAPSWPESANLDWDGTLEFYGRWLWAPLVLVILVCNFSYFLRRRFELIPVAVTLYTFFLAFQNLVTFEGRYRKPLEPLLLVNLVWSVVAWKANAQVDEASDRTVSSGTPK
jgi:Dolichyl-phosphate-mannose-protein mannosyltransferase